MQHDSGGVGLGWVGLRQESGRLASHWHIFLRPQVKLELPPSSNSLIFVKELENTRIIIDGARSNAHNWKVSDGERRKYAVGA